MILNLSFMAQLLGVGACSDEQAKVFQFGYPDPIPTTQRTAAGTNFATAKLVDKPVVDLTTVAASTGIRLSQILRGRLVVVYNGGANTVNIFPPASTDTINGGSAGAAVTLATTKTKLLWCIGSGLWRAVGVD